MTYDAETGKLRASTPVKPGTHLPTSPLRPGRSPERLGRLHHRLLVRHARSAARGSSAATEPEAAAALGAEGLPVLLLGRNLLDVEGHIGAWLSRFGASWVVLRPDRFVFALGSTRPQIDHALAELHRQMGSPHEVRPKADSDVPGIGHSWRRVPGKARPY